MWFIHVRITDVFLDNPKSGIQNFKTQLALAFVFLVTWCLCEHVSKSTMKAQYQIKLNIISIN